ncbi:unnamed protein product, partial [Sphagnum troendelagicum]
MAERKDGHDAAAAAASSASTALDGVEGDGKTAIQDDAWLPSDSFVHEPPVLKVMQPKGTFCEIQARFSVALPPDGVYDIITDPNNRRVFKNIKEVCYRKVLEDDGNRQLVEVEQLGRWRFLMFSGTFSSRVMVEQNRQDHQMLFDLAKQGMMRKFSGSWKIDSMYASEQKSQAADSESEVVGAWVNFHQLLEPAILPPWPLSRYVRGVSERIIREMCSDLQHECLRLSQLDNDEEDDEEASSNSGRSSACQECGNQAKKDCSYQRCRTCCKSRGFECSTHLKSTWVPAAKRRERQAAEASATSSGGLLLHRPGKSKHARTTTIATALVANATNSLTTTSAISLQGGGGGASDLNNSAHLTATHPSQTMSSSKGGLPPEVRAQALFKCVRLMGVEDSENEFAYQATVKIGGHIFKGVLYDQGKEVKRKGPVISSDFLGFSFGGGGGGG